jgi:hypothetical protein
MVSSWGFGTVTELTSDSSNIAAAVIAGLSGTSGSVTDEPIMMFGTGDTPITNSDNTFLDSTLIA